MKPSSSGPSYKSILLLAFISGGLALAQQLLWTRRMVDLLGAAAGSTARVFACFFLGLALGAQAAGRMAARTRRPWRAVALAEFAVALLSVPMLLLPWWADGLWPALGADRLVSGPGALLKTLLSILLVLPPAFAMGFFLPLAGSTLDLRRDPDRDPGLPLYVANTFGALAGILFVVFLLPRGIGIFTAMRLVIFGNLFSAGVYLYFDHLSEPSATILPEPPPSPAASSVTKSFSPRTLHGVAALSGFLVLALEVTALSLIQLVAPLSFFAPGAILLTFIGILAFCSLSVTTFPFTRFWQKHGLFTSAAASGIGLWFSPLLFHTFAPHFPVDTPAASLPAFFLRIAFFTLLVFGPAVFFAGLWFPLAARLSATASLNSTGTRWGGLLAVNGLGGWLGAEAAYRFLLPAFGPFGTLGLLGALYLFAANILLHNEASPWLKRATLALFFVGSYLSLQVFPSLPTTHPGLRPHVREESHGREGSFAILDHPVMGRAILMYNQYILGSSQATPAQARQAHIPLLLHPAPRRVGFLGAGTGISPGAALAHQAVEHLETAEISGTVAEAAHRWFAAENRNWFTDPRSTVHIEDARTWIAAGPGRFDVLISDLFLPWGPGEGRLFTVEHFQACRAALAPGGLFCMWLPLYQLTEDQVTLILNSFQTVFGTTHLLLRETSPEAPALGLIGGTSQTLHWTTVQTRLAAEILTDPEIATLDLLKALHLTTLPIPEHPLAPLNTLDNLRLELDAARIQLLYGNHAPYLRGARFTTWREQFQ